MKFSKTLLLITMLLLPATCAAYTVPSATQQSYDCDLCDTTQPIVYEDALAFVIRDLHSTLKTSLLIVPKKHVANLSELNLNTRADQLLLAHLISLAQQTFASRLTGTQSYRITINTGNALQDTPHLYIHFESNDSLQKA